MITLISAGNALAATTHYIAANGSDSNNGSSTSTPWLHAPGMPGCSSSCASYTPVAGDQFLFRGGDTWHTSAGSPVGMPWSWTWSGSSAHCNYNANDTSTCIYIGVDQAWYSGSSWTRPVLTMDNPLTTGFPSSCGYDDTNLSGVTLNSANYIIFDNFEFTGKCWAGNPFAGTLRPLGTHITMSNLYFHGWSVVKGSVDTHYMILGGNPGTVTNNIIVGNVFDGSDSSHGTGGSAGCTPVANEGSPCASGFAVYFDAYDVHNSVFRYLSNGIVGTSMYTMHDNLFEYMWNSYDDTTHPNVIESVGGISGSNLYFYNNIIRYTHQNVLYWPQWAATAYMFNNVLFENDNGQAGTGGNCFMLSPTSNGDTPKAYIYNNTFADDDGVCQFNFFPGNSSTPAWAGTAFFQNNHFITSGASLSSLINGSCSSSTCYTDNGHEIFQTVSVANGEGYMASDNYAPTSDSGATVGAGANLTGSCSVFSSDSALCSGTGEGASEGPKDVAVYPAIPPVPRPSTGVWDSGAYQIGGNQPAPPTGLTVVVN